MSTLFRQYVAQELVQWTDLEGDNDATRNLVAEAIEMLLGSANATITTGTATAYGSGFTPLAVTLSNSALSLSLGGGTQAVIAQGRLVDTCPLQTFSIPTNSGQQRVDLIAIQYNQITTQPYPITLNTPSGPASSTGYLLEEGLQYSYVQGTSGVQTPPAAPAGYIAFATVTVPNNATLGTSCTVSYLFPTIASLLSGVINTGVTSVNGQVGAVVLSGGSGITVAVVGGQIVISTTNAGVGGINGLTGNITLAAGNGILLSVNSTTNVITISANPALTPVGYSTASFATGGSGTTSLTASLTALGAGTWTVEAICHGFEWTGSGSANIQGSGTGFTAQSGTAYTNSTRTLFIAGTCAGGVAPSVTLTATGVTLQPNTTAITLLIRATRIL